MGTKKPDSMRSALFELIGESDYNRDTVTGYLQTHRDKALNFEYAKREDWEAPAMLEAFKRMREKKYADIFTDYNTIPRFMQLWGAVIQRAEEKRTTKK